MMRRWAPYLAIVLFHVALIIIIVTWVRPLLMLQRVSARDQLSIRYSELQHRVMYENQQLRHAVVRDSLQRTLPPGRGYFVADMDSATGYLERVLQRELPPQPNAMIGVTTVPLRYGTHPGVSDFFSTTMTIAGEKAGVPYCIIVLPQHHEQQTRFLAPQIAWTGLSGQCHFYARYGAPGPQIERWLAEGGARHFARYNQTQRHSWPAFPGEMPPNFAARMRRELPLRGQKCLSGDREVCAASISSFELTQDERERYYRLTGTPRLVFGEGSMLAVLEQEFGPQRFERFWQSSRPLPEAFAEAFDEPLGDWVYRWVGPLGHIRAGARLDLSSLLLTLLLLGALAGSALLTAQNRRI